MASPTFSLSSLGPLADIASYHIMLFGTLLGTELYQVCAFDTSDEQTLLTAI